MKQTMATGLVCLYVIQDAGEPEEPTYRRGSGLVLQLSHGSMTLCLDVRPDLEQMFEIRIFHPRIGQTISLVQPRNIRPGEDRNDWVIDCTLAFGPYSTVQERMCQPYEFFLP